MADPYDFLESLNSAICPTTPAPVSPLDVTQADVLAGQKQLSALTGTFLPSVGAPPTTRGATVIAGGGGEPVLSKDLTARSANLSFGWMGEQSGAFFWGLRGYDMLFGPSGSGGKATNAHGADGLPWNPVTKSGVLWDNKQSVYTNGINKCEALNENLIDSIDIAAKSVTVITHPDQGLVLQTLEQARRSLTEPEQSRWPDNLRLVMTNAGGFAGPPSQPLLDEFSARWGRTLTSSGEPIKLEYENAQPPPTVQAAQATQQTIEMQGEPQVPLTYKATPSDSVTRPYDAVASNEAIGPPLMSAAPVLIQMLTGVLSFVLPRLGVKSNIERSVDNAVQSEVLPHLRDNSEEGALLMVTVRDVAYSPDVDASQNVASVLPFYGMTAQEAFEQRLATSFFQATDDPHTTRHDVYFWYQNGKITPYSPGRH